MKRPASSEATVKIPRRRIIIITVFLLIVSFPAAYFLYKKEKEVKTELTRWKEEYEEPVPEENYEPKEGSLTKTFVIREKTIRLPHQADPVLLKVYWHPSLAINLVIDSLAALPKGEKYQVWLLSGEQRKNLGLYDAPENNRPLIITVADAAMTDTYEITVVKINKEPPPR